MRRRLDLELVRRSHYRTIELDHGHIVQDIVPELAALPDPLLPLRSATAGRRRIPE